MLNKIDQLGVQKLTAPSFESMSEPATTAVSRRSFLKNTSAGLGLSALPAGLSGFAASTLAASSVEAAEPDSLGAIAARAGITFGTSIANDIHSSPAYRQLIAREARILTTDYALKFGNMRPADNQFSYADADSLLTFARLHNLPLRGHTLIWNENPPPWLKGKSNAELARIFDQHIDTVAGYYSGKLHSWDVVNEAFWPGHNIKGGYRDGPWYSAFGPSYIRRAFRRTAAMDKKALFVLNEAHCERQDELGLTMRACMLRQVDELLDAGVPLHAVGLQAHLQPQYPSDDAAYVAFLRALSARGIAIYLTELDVDDRIFPEDTKIRDEKIAARVYAFLSAVLAVPNVKTVITWQLSDGHSWYRDKPVMADMGRKSLPRPLPFDVDMKKKPMFEALSRAFRERKTS